MGIRTAFGTEEDCFSDYKDLIAAAHKASSVKVKIDAFNRFSMMNGSDIDLLCVQEDGSEHTYFCIQLLESAQKEILWILTQDISINETQYDIAEAIIYSFAFDIRKRG